MIRDSIWSCCICWLRSLWQSLWLKHGLKYPTNLLVSLLFNNLLSLQIFFDLIQLITLFNTNMFLLRFKCFFCLKFFNTYLVLFFTDRHEFKDNKIQIIWFTDSKKKKSITKKIHMATWLQNFSNKLLCYPWYIILNLRNQYNLLQRCNLTWSTWTLCYRW